MANLRKTRKRVHGIPRAADGSAFQKCNTCGASVPIALAGMHECDLNPKVKRFKGVCLDVQQQSFYDQLIVMSPFHFFMKEFTKTSKAGNWVAINREGFEAWKNMSEKERQPYVAEADKVDKAYEKALLEEVDDKLKVDDEADSAMAGNNEKAGEFYGDYENSDGTDELWDNYGRAGSWQTYARPIGIQLAMVENLHPEIIFPLPVFSKGLEALYSSLMDCACSNFRSSSLLLLGRSPSLHPHYSFPSKLRFLTLKRLNLAKHARVVRSACGFNENGSVNGFSVTPNKLFMQEAIGAEYGEGFETFRPDGPLKVDVDFLNDRLQEGFLQRIRYAMKPDEAYGLIFSFDNVVADTRTLKLNSWKQLASEEGKEIPEDADVQGRMLYAGADHVLHKLLLWDEAEGELDRLALRFSQLYYDNLLRLSKPVEGLKEWLDAVSTARIPCAVVSSLDRINMTEALERMELKKYFQAIVTEEDGMDSIAHRFLSAAMKLDRKPSKCVVFEDEPRGIAAAHNCTMMAVALIGAHPAYDLVQADLAVASFNELSVINLRRLFANKGSTFMDLQKQVIEKSPPKRKLTIDTIF